MAGGGTVGVLLVIALLLAGGAAGGARTNVSTFETGPVPSASPVFEVNFSTHALPSGDTWTVTLGGVPQTSASPVITFLEVNGSYPYSIQGPAGYNATVPTGTVVVHGASQTVDVSWVTHLFPVTFTETGLPTQNTWHVFVDYANKEVNAGLSILFFLPNGTFTFTVGADIPWVATPGKGTVTVHGAGLSIPVTFSPPPAHYTITFAEQGLPNGTVWSYSIVGVVHSAIAPIPVALLYGNGSYAFTVAPTGSYVPHPGSGTVTVNGADASVTILFTPPQNYSVEFTESGLPGGNWTISIVDPAETGSAPSSHAITFLLPNGSYTFRPGTTTSGWSPKETVGAFLVAGANITVPAVAFTSSALLWPVEFVPYSAGSSAWWVAIGNRSWNGTGETPLNIELTNGTYAWTAGGSGGLYPHPPGGTFTVAGGKTVVDLTFLPGASKAVTSGLVATYGTDLLVAGILVIGAIVVLAAVVVRRGGGSRPPTATGVRGSGGSGGPDGRR